MNDYENIKNLEAESYKGLGSMNEDKIVATSDLSNAVSAICYNLSNMLDKRDENSIVSGSVEISGTLSALEDITTSSDIHAFRHGLVGKDVDFSTGGDEVLVVGHEHKIYGKESFVAGNEGNILGAKAFHWKAIDTTNNLIYLTHEQTKFNSNKLKSTSYLSGSNGNFISYDQYKQYDIPYFGPRNGSYLSDESNASCLFKVDADNQISILKDDVYSGNPPKLVQKGAVGKTLILNNVQNIPYFRKLVVEDVLSGSVLSVSGLDTIEPLYQQTHYRKNTNHTYHGNYYFVCFQDVSDISTYTDVGWEKNMTFGCAALGENNCTIGYNSFAIGKDNTTEGNYSIALGHSAKAGNNSVFAWSSGGAYNVSGEGQFGINPKGGISGFYIGDKSLAYYLNDLSGDLDGEIQRKLDKYDGGIVSGNVGVFQHDMKILSGNYIQATDPTHVYNYSQKNTFIQAEEAFSGSGKSYGPANTGSYGYCVLSVVNGTNYRGLKLSGDISKLIALLDNNAAGAGINYDYSASKSLTAVLNDTTSISNALFSLALSDQGETMRYQISSIDQVNNIVYLKQAFSTATAGLTSLSEESCISLWENDDNAFYVAGFPEIGNAVVKNFYAQHVEGGSSRAVGKYTHAEGRDNIADVRYSHVEGAHNIAAGMATHAEGFQNKVIGKYAHVEGNLNVVNGLYAHAEGKNTAASGNQSHAEGFNTVASGAGSHAEGGNGTSKGGTATGGGSHAEGISSLASGAGSHAEGWSTYATSYAAHVEGNATSADVRGAHAEGGFGYDKSISSYNSTGQATKSTVINIPYNGAFAHKMAAHAEGAGTHAEGIASHAEGCGSYIKANCHGAHAEGGEVKSTIHREYDSFGRLSAQWSEYECINQTSAMNVAAHAEGLATQAIGKASHAAGISAVAANNCSYVWNGISSTNYNPGKGDGTFCINPVDSTNGFYIGSQNLCSIISGEIDSAQSHADSAVQQLKSQISSALSTLTADPLSSLTYSSDIDKVISAAVEMRNILSSLYDAMRS